MLRPKKNSYKEFDNEKKFLPLENSPPPHNVSNGPSLIDYSTYFKGVIQYYYCQFSTVSANRGF